MPISGDVAVNDMHFHVDSQKFDALQWRKDNQVLALTAMGDDRDRFVVLSK
jgi:hypothetical protein